MTTKERKAQEMKDWTAQETLVQILERGRVLEATIAELQKLVTVYGNSQPKYKETSSPDLTSLTEMIDRLYRKLGKLTEAVQHMVC